MIQSNLQDPARDLNTEVTFKLLSRLGMHFEIAVDHSDVLEIDESNVDAVEITEETDKDVPLVNHSPRMKRLIGSAEKAGIVLRSIEVDDIDEARAFLNESYPLVVAHGDGTYTVLDSVSGGHWQSTRIGNRVDEQTLRRSEVRELLWGNPDNIVLVAKKQLDLDGISAAPYHSIKYHHEKPSPMRRFIGLLRLEMRDIITVVLFAFVAGVLTLATPLAVETLVNVVSWGTYVQPLIVLGLILFVCLGIAGVLRILQTWVVELIQRRQFVRIISDLSHRFPRVERAALRGKYPRELANRVFDVMTIQKATAVLLLDGVSIVLTTGLGLMLLAFYHPFLLGFDIVLVFSMVLFTWMLGRGGVQTAIEESVTKYRVAHWLQDVLDSPAAFKTGGGEPLAIQRANQLTSDYISARRRQFGVVIRQSAFAITVQVVASTGLLALGGWLVIDGQLTLAQLVASELVVTMVVGAFAKAGKSLEKFYDLMAGIDKVGQLIDLPADPSQSDGYHPVEPLEVVWSDLSFRRATSKSEVAACEVPSAARVAIVGQDVDGRTDLARAIAGMIRPDSGAIRVGQKEAGEVASGSSGIVGFAGTKEVFHGTIRENIDLGRSGVSAGRVREVLSQVGLIDAVLHLEDGMQTLMQTDGYPLTPSQVTLLVIARAIAARPRLLVIDRLLDELPEDSRRRVWKTIADPDAPWTLIVTSNHSAIADLCETKIHLHRCP